MSLDPRFQACLSVILIQEGGWSDNPHDPGGATYRGVTQSVYNAYRRQCARQIQSVHLMNPDECAQIYQSQYWIAAHAPDLPVGLDLCQFDEAVNTGPVEATKLLQQALGISVDGAFGLETAGAVQACTDVPALIKKVCAARLSFYKRLRDWIYFGKGWYSRDAAIQEKALAMYEASK